jgi:hypothetical protein
LDDSYFKMIDSSIGRIKIKVEYLSKLNFIPSELPTEPLHTDIEFNDVQQPIITEKNEFEMNCEPPFEIKYLKANSFYEESKLEGNQFSGDYFKEDYFNLKNTPTKYEKKASIMFYSLENDDDEMEYLLNENLLFENPRIVKENNNINDLLLLLNNNQINRVEFVSNKFENMEKFINDTENNILDL